MDSKNILQKIAYELIKSKNRHHAHSKLKPQFERLCNDKTFIFDALEDCISRSSFWEKPDNLVFPLYLSGDIIISINLFVPIRDKAKNITQDNIHHHGWRFLGWAFETFKNIPQTCGVRRYSSTTYSVAKVSVLRSLVIWCCRAKGATCFCCCRAEARLLGSFCSHG